MADIELRPGGAEGEGFDMQSRAWLAFILVPIALFAGCSGKKDETGTSDTTQRHDSSLATDDQAHDVDLQANGRDLAKLVELIVRGAADLPREEFDPAALAAKLGKDPRAHFVWVRDHTYWAPYRGLLRGSKGVMLDRVGSSLDRAVLLGDLLRRSGYNVRLAHAMLPEARAREILVKLRPIPDQGGVRMAQRQNGESKRTIEEARSLVRSQLDLLRAKTRDLAVQSKPDLDAVADALLDHWWVEREHEGKWIAMDVVLPDSEVGESLIDATHRSNWTAADDWPSVPDTDWHAVQVRVVVESYENGKATESTALETLIRPANVLDRPIMFGHMPMQWPEDVPDPKDDPNALGNAAVNVKEWVPYLKIGREFVAQSAFNDEGAVIADLQSSQKDINELGGGSLFGGFDDALSGGAAGASGQLTAEWIDYEIRVPGKPNQRLRRPVFDLLGPAQRSAKVENFDATTNEHLIERSEALLSGTDILLQPCAFSSEFISHLKTASIVANQKEFSELSRETDPARTRERALRIFDRLDIWGPLPTLANLRTDIGIQAGDWFVDRPNILNYRISQPVVNADTQPPREMIDFAANGIGVRPNSSRTSFDVRLHQGVADTVAEAVALGADLRGAANAASILQSAGGAADRSVLIEPRSADEVGQLGWPEDAASRLANNIDAGFAAVVPIDAVLVDERQRVGWWRVDPASGETIGVLDSGFHGVDEDAQLRAELQWLHDRLMVDYRRLSRDRVSRLMRGQSLEHGTELDLALGNLLTNLRFYIALF